MLIAVLTSLVLTYSTCVAHCVFMWSLVKTLIKTQFCLKTCRHISKCLKYITSVFKTIRDSKNHVILNGRIVIRYSLRVNLEGIVMLLTQVWNNIEQHKLKKKLLKFECAAVQPEQFEFTPQMNHSKMFLKFTSDSLNETLIFFFFQLGPIRNEHHFIF